MRLSRRTVVAGLLAAPFVWPARARAAAFAEAARYSADSRGVSFLVLENGRTLYEDYPNGGGPGRTWALASGTKSFCGILAAAAAADGLLRLDEPCADTLPEWAGDRRKSQITLRHLLTLTSGLKGRIGEAPAYADAITQRARRKPGKRFQYGPVPFQTFGEVLRRKLKAAGRPDDPLSYLQSRVFDRLDLRTTGWRRGEDGYPILPHGAHFSAQQWGRFGQYILDGGSGLDGQVLSACFEGTEANPGYGLTWWLLRDGLVPPGPRSGIGGSMPDEIERADVVMAAGAGNQRLYLIRSRGLVVVRQATGILAALRGQGAAWSDTKFLKTLLAV